MDVNINNLKIPIIIDIGSSEVRAGFSKSKVPKVIFSNCFGQAKYQKVFRTFDKQDKKDVFIGEECDNFSGLIKIRYPVKHGVFQNEDDILPLFSHIFSKLGIKSDEIKDHPILLSEPLLNPPLNREKISSILFDNLQVPGLFFASQPILSLFSNGFQKGAVLESGEGVTQSCAIFDGFSIPESFQRYNYGGGDVTEYLRSKLRKRGYCFYNTTDIKYLNEIKEKYCQIRNLIYLNTTDLEFQNRNYNLPDGKIIQIGDQEIYSFEMLFNNDILGEESLCFTDMLEKTINSVNIDCKEILRRNILLSGGNTSFSDIEERIEKKIWNKSLRSDKGRIVKAQEPKLSVWIGGNLVSTLDIFKKMWISRDEWSEKGIKIIHSKTF